MIKFALISQARSGGTLIGSALAMDHSDIVYFGEIFHKDPLVRASEADHKTISLHPIKNIFNTSITPYDSQKPMEYINDFYEKFKYQKAVGFKSHYDHFESTWQVLPILKDVKIIHLKRNNLLNSYISLEKANTFFQNKF